MQYNTTAQFDNVRITTSDINLSAQEQPLRSPCLSMTHLPPPPPATTQKPTHTNTFVHKLYNMVIDSHYQHLIAWAYAGTSFIVCNIMEFSRDVLPKHFKHNNFSSFVRQLNMYGFHKVNKSPRGHRTLAENQIWEFSHAKFIRNKPDLLDEIKRKTMETSDLNRRDTNSSQNQLELQNHLSILQNAQAEMIQQIQHLYNNFKDVLKELESTKQKQENHFEMMRSLMNYILQQNNGQIPNELRHTYDSLNNTKSLLTAEKQPPSIFITSHDPAHGGNNHFQPNSPQPQHIHRLSQQSPHISIDDIFDAATRNTSSNSNTINVQSLSPLGPYFQNNSSHQLPPSPSPSMLLSDDDIDNSSSLYSPNSPHTPRHLHTSSSVHSDPMNSNNNNNNDNHNHNSNSFMSTMSPLSH